MPNVRLRTIINQDNSTTFQVQFTDGGEWVDLTWEMISDKPFESLDDTVFIVDEDGVLSIINIPTTCDWSDVTDKPFTTLNPSDFSVNESGVLSYSGTFDWSSVGDKPFTTLDPDDFEVSADGELSVRHQTIPNQTWNQITGKPFSSLDSDTFQVVGGVLYLNLNPSTPNWNDVQGKPFSTLDSGDFSVSGGVLKTIKQVWNTLTGKPFNSLNPSDFSVLDGVLSTIKQTWNTLTGKPFNTLSPDDFTLTDGELGVNFPAQLDPEWDDVEQKPFETLDNSDFSVDADGKLAVNFPTPSPDDWDDITNKPFSSLNSSDFSVDADGELSVIGGGGSGIGWSDIQYPLYRTWDDKLTTNIVVQDFTSMANDNKLSSLTQIRDYIKTFVLNSLKLELGLINSPIAGYTGPLLDKAVNIVEAAWLIDTSQPDLSMFSMGNTAKIMMTRTTRGEYGSYTDFLINVEADALPYYNDANIDMHLSGYMIVRGYKSGDTYTSVSVFDTSFRYFDENFYSFS